MLQSIFNALHGLTSPKDVNSSVFEYNQNRDKADRKALCHAPFKSMYFAQNGIIRACCYNRSYVYGSFPHHMPSDVFKGQNIKKLRKALIQTKLSMGCFICQQSLQHKNYTSIAARNYDKLPPASQHPHILEFECDTTCNLECIMCSGEYSSAIRTRRENLPIEANPYNDAFIDNIRPWLKTISDARFNGGEPFLSPLYHKIWNIIITENPSCTISVQTNATVLNDAIKDMLQKGRFNISVSLDALDKELYETIRKGATFETVMQNTLFLAEYCRSKDTHFGISVCPMRINRNEMPSLLHWANDNGAQLFFHNVWFPPHLALWNMNSSELEHISTYLARFKFNARNNTDSANINTYRALINTINLWCDAARIREQNPNTFTNAADMRSAVLEGLNSFCAAQSATNAKPDYEAILDTILNHFTEKEQCLCLAELLKAPSEFVCTLLETFGTNAIVYGLKNMLNTSES